MGSGYWLLYVIGYALEDVFMGKNSFTSDISNIAEGTEWRIIMEWATLP